MTINSIKQFIESLQHDVRKLDSLISALEQQYVLLSERDTTLQQHNAKMSAVLQSLDKNHLSRDSYLQSLGLAQGKEGLMMLVEKLPKEIKLTTQTLMQQLVIKSKHCQALNERSGLLLARQKQLLHRLTGTQSKTAYPESPF